MVRVGEQAFRSDTGRQRTANEDSYFASAPLFVVADGMGGAQAGEVASRIAAESFEEAERTGTEPAEAFLRRITEAANQRIHGLAQHDSTRSGMGTTLTAALVHDDDVAFAHVGDSRAYLWRDGRADPPHVRPFAGRGAASPGQAHRGAGRGSSAALDHHPRARTGGQRRGRHVHAQRPARRRVPALLGWPDDDGQGRPDR